MTTPTWAEAKTETTQEEARADLLEACDDQGCTVNGWTEVAPQRALVEGNASAIAYASRVRAGLAKTASPSSATEAGDTWVDAVLSWFDLEDGTGGKGRIKATKAEWNIPLIVTASAAPLVIDNTSTIQLQAEDGTIFECAQQTSITLNSASSYKGTARFLARKTGTTGNQTPGQIKKRIAGPAGLSVDLLSTQVLVTAGRDEETSAQYIARGLSKWGTISIAGWVKDSFLYLVTQADPTITRVKIEDDNPLGPGTTRVTIATAAGAPSGGQVTTVSGALAARNRKTLGNSPPYVQAATVTTVNIVGTVYGDGTNGSLLANINAALQKLQSVFGIGGDENNPGVLELELVHAVLIGARFDQYGLVGFTGTKNKLALSSPVADTSISSSAVIQFDTSGLVIG